MVAATGYGKSIALAGWCEAVGGVLHRLGPADRDLPTLAGALVGALSAAVPGLRLGLAPARGGGDVGGGRADPAWRQEVHVYRGVADFFAGRLTDASGSLARALWCGPMTVRAAAHALPTLLDARCAAHAFAGELNAAERTAAEGMALPAAELSVSGFAAHRALASRLRGDAVAATRWCEEDASRLPARSPYQGRCLAELAHASALLGRTAQARAALAEAEAAASRWAFTRQHVLQAAVWVAAASGDLDEAVRACLTAAELAERQEHLGFLMFALHDLVRLGVPARAATRPSCGPSRAGSSSSAWCCTPPRRAPRTRPRTGRRAGGASPGARRPGRGRWPAAARGCPRPPWWSWRRRS
ncbi:hypothetical protein ABT294_40295 [Nonomuraea sp. NPDC000554]|uniref:hypothetical protein n=1 Tax=Nonomuraea sp. NPDC000554 TaxID=3154259 RepID=UPI0033198CF0